MESYCDAEKIFHNLTNLLRCEKNHRMKLSDVEHLVKNEGKTLLCSLLQSHINDRGDGDVGDFIVGSDGIPRHYKRLGKREIKTIFGKITIQRTGYSAKGTSTLYPKDAQLNLPRNSYSFALKKFVVQEVIKSSFDSAIGTINRLVGITVPKLQAEIIATESAVDFDQYYYDKKKKQEKDGDILVMTIDGKGIVMIKDSLREGTKKGPN